MATKPTKPVKKTAPKAEKKTAPARVSSGLSVSVFDAQGKTSGKAAFPEALFGEKVNKALLAQSVRVYLANQRAGTAKTKTRGEVEGSTRKIYKQKGTGRARHGSIRAPIFVGGGIVFGPVTRDFRLSMSKSMKRAALRSALSEKAQHMVVIDGLETIEPKTKNVVAALRAMDATGKVLLVVPKDSEKLVKAARNIENLTLIAATDLHPYAIVMHKTIVFTKKALAESTAHFS